MSHSGSGTIRGGGTSAQRGTGTFVQRISGGTKTSFAPASVISGAPQKLIRGGAEFIQQTGRNLAGELINPSAPGGTSQSSSSAPALTTPNVMVGITSTGAQVPTATNLERFAREQISASKPRSISPEKSRSSQIDSNGLLIVGGLALLAFMASR